MKTVVVKTLGKTKKFENVTSIIYDRDCRSVKLEIGDSWIEFSTATLVCFEVF